MNDTTALSTKTDAGLSAAAPAVHPVSAFSSIDAFDAVQRMAKLLASSKLIPKEYQGDIPNCVIAMEMANRIGTSPLPVMQSLVIVHGRPTWSAQWVIAAINSTGKFSPLRFEISDEGPEEKVEYTYFVDRKPRKGVEVIRDRKCRAWCIELSTGEQLRSTEISIRMAVHEGWYSKPGSKWQTMAEQMLQYRAAAFFGRLYAPEILLGMPTNEEARDAYDLNKVDADGNVIEDMTSTQALNASVKASKKTAKQTPEPKPEPKTDHKPDPSLQALARCRNDMSACTDIDTLDQVVDAARDEITNPVHKDLAKEHYTLCVRTLEGQGE